MSLKKQKILDIKNLLKDVGLEEKQKIADIGCGRRGSFTIQAAKMVGKNGIVFAVDILKPALKNVRSKAELFKISNIKTIWADLEVYKSTKIPDNEIDVVILSNTLFQSEKPKMILKEAKRILKKNGKILVIDWKSTDSPLGPPVEKRIKDKKVKELAKDLDLKLVKEFEAGYYHYGFIYKK
ncbi:MAG TPA: class I SAM-dependent methyltransferase [Patescibacteria group bacterium]|nr:class I SAM-dependent methyltransferase [Patescibacteria group bacterium]